MDDHIWFGFVIPNLSVLLLALVILFSARRWPVVVFTLIGVSLVCGVSLLTYAKATCIGYNEQIGEVSFGSNTGQVCYRLGLVLVSVGLPAVLLALAARERQPSGIGPSGLTQYATLIFGYWCCCGIVGLILYTALTGHVK